MVFGGGFFGARKEPWQRAIWSWCINLRRSSEKLFSHWEIIFHYLGIVVGSELGRKSG
jgi:hypothetical protein